MKSIFYTCMILALGVSPLTFASYNYKMEKLEKKVEKKKNDILNQIKKEGFTESLLNQLSEVNKEDSFVDLYYLSKVIARTLVEL